MSRGRRRLLALAGLSAAAYAVAAWAVTPGFFDGFAPPQPYRWLEPPPGVKNGGTPAAGRLQLKVASNGQVDPGTAFTTEDQPQASLSVIPGAFQPPSGGAPVTITITPVTAHPEPAGLVCVTNVYEIRSTSPLAKDALVTLRFSDALPAPSDIYRAPPSGGGWTRIGNIGASAPFYISARTTELGYFAGCYPGQATAARTGGVRVGGSQTLPILVAVAILLVVLGGIPLALLRRRGGGEEPEA